jgi:HrpA-like RNA helicase
VEFSSAISSHAWVFEREFHVTCSTEKRQKMLDQKESMPSPKPAILSVEGRAHSVLVHYAEEPVQDYLRAAVSTTLSIHKTEGPGDVLVFLTGQDDVDTAVQLINEEAETLPRNTAGIYNSCNLFCVLHGHCSICPSTLTYMCVSDFLVACCNKKLRKGGN